LLLLPRHRTPSPAACPAGCRRRWVWRLLSTPPVLLLLALLVLALLVL
jgi:hypothetical protein